MRLEDSKSKGAMFRKTLHTSIGRSEAFVIHQVASYEVALRDRLKFKAQVLIFDVFCLMDVEVILLVFRGAFCVLISPFIHVH